MVSRNIVALILLLVRSSAVAASVSAAACVDDTAYKSKLGMSCSQHLLLNCQGFAKLEGFSDDETEELLNNCPASCGVASCETERRKLLLGANKAAYKTMGLPKASFESLTKEGGLRTHQQAAACNVGWPSSCQDDASYVSKIGLSCSQMIVFACADMERIGFTPTETHDLINSCPCACGIECGTWTWAPTETPSVTPTTLSPTIAPTIKPSAAPVTSSPTFVPTTKPSVAPVTASPTAVPISHAPTAVPTPAPSPPPANATIFVPQGLEKAPHSSSSGGGTSPLTISLLIATGTALAVLAVVAAYHVRTNKTRIVKDNGRFKNLDKDVEERSEASTLADDRCMIICDDEYNSTTNPMESGEANKSQPRPSSPLVRMLEEETTFSKPTTKCNEASLGASTIATNDHVSFPDVVFDDNMPYALSAKHDEMSEKTPKISNLLVMPFWHRKKHGNTKQVNNNVPEEEHGGEHERESIEQVLEQVKEEKAPADVESSDSEPLNQIPTDTSTTRAVITMGRGCNDGCTGILSSNCNDATCNKMTPKWPAIAPTDFNVKEYEAQVVKEANFYHDAMQKSFSPVLDEQSTFSRDDTRSRATTAWSSWSRSNDCERSLKSRDETKTKSQAIEPDSAPEPTEPTPESNAATPETTPPVVKTTTCSVPDENSEASIVVGHKERDRLFRDMHETGALIAHDTGALIGVLGHSIKECVQDTVDTVNEPSPEVSSESMSTTPLDFFSSFGNYLPTIASSFFPGKKQMANIAEDKEETDNNGNGVGDNGGDDDSHITGFTAVTSSPLQATRPAPQPAAPEEQQHHTDDVAVKTNLNKKSFALSLSRSLVHSPRRSKSPLRGSRPKKTAPKNQKAQKTTSSDPPASPMPESSEAGEVFMTNHPMADNTQARTGHGGRVVKGIHTTPSEAHHEHQVHRLLPAEQEDEDSQAYTATPMTRDTSCIMAKEDDYEIVSKMKALQQQWSVWQQRLDPDETWDDSTYADDTLYSKRQAKRTQQEVESVSSLNSTMKTERTHQQAESEPDPEPEPAKAGKSPTQASVSFRPLPSPELSSSRRPSKEVSIMTDEASASGSKKSTGTSSSKVPTSRRKSTSSSQDPSTDSPIKIVERKNTVKSVSSLTNIGAFTTATLHRQKAVHKGLEKKRGAQKSKAKKSNIRAKTIVVRK